MAIRVDQTGIVISDGVRPVEYHWSPRCMRMSKGAPVGVCWHYTAVSDGASNRADLAMVKRIQQINPADRVSWHILIGENGTIYQSVRLVNGAWHVRKSAPGTPAELVGGVNRWLIGVELESRDGRNFAPALVDAARELIGALHEWRPDWPAAAYTYGHHQFDPARRSDPGPEWLALLPSLLPAR